MRVSFDLVLLIQDLLRLKFGNTEGIPAYPWKPFMDLWHSAANNVGITGLVYLSLDCTETIVSTNSEPVLYHTIQSLNCLNIRLQCIEFSMYSYPYIGWICVLCSVTQINLLMRTIY